MEWQKTTFGELKAGDWYCYEEPPTMFFKFIEGIADTPPNAIVYCLVSPASAERESLEKIRPLLQEVVDTYNAPREISQNFDWLEFIERATAALEVKP